MAQLTDKSKSVYSRVQYYKSFLQLRCIRLQGVLLAQCYIIVYNRNLLIFVISQSVGLGRPIQPSLMFVGKAKSLTQSRAPKRCQSRVGSSLTPKHLTWLERPASDKHSSLLQTFVNYDRKNLKVPSWGQCYKTFCVRNLPRLVICQSVCPWQAFPAYSNLCV